MEETPYHATGKEANGIQYQNQISDEETRNDDHGTFCRKKQNVGKTDDSVPAGDVTDKTVKFYNCENKGIVFVFYFAVLVLTGFALVVNQYIDINNIEREKFSVNIFKTEIFVMIIMLVSVLCIAGFWIWIRRESKRVSTKAEENVSDSDAGQPGEMDSITYLLGSVFVFAVGTFLMIVLEITDYFHCGVLLSKKRSSIETAWEKEHYPTHFAFYLIQLMFTMAQLFFLSKYFSSPKLKSSLVILFLVHLLATNVIFSLFVLTAETGILFGSHEKDTNFENLSCSNLPNGTDYLHEILGDTKPYLEPFVIEYALIVAGMILSMIGHAARNNQKQKRTEEPEGENALFKDHEREERNTRSPATASELTSDSYGSKMHPDVRQMVKRNPEALFLFVIGIVLGLFMIVSSWSLKDVTHYKNVLIYSYAIQVFIFLLEAISSIYILSKLPAKSRKARSLKTDDRLLLISVGLGVVMLNIFTFIASLGALGKKPIVVETAEGNILIKHASSLAIFLLFFCVINVISSLVETYMIIEAQSFKRPLSRSLLSDVPTGPIIFLLVINISHWIKDAFFELKNDGRRTFPFGEEFYHKFAWQLMTRGTYPLCIFFRFHAAAMLFEVWRKVLPKDLVWVLKDHNPSSHSQKQSLLDMETTQPQQYPRCPSPLPDSKPKEVAQQSWDPTA